MPGVARVGVDTAGGTIQGGGQSTVFCNGSLVAVLGDAVQGHGIGAHAGPTMAEASTNVFAEGIGVCRQGDEATCGDAATGSSDTFAN